MNKSPLITVVVPVYNVENYLAECVQSLLCQTYTHYEIILVDDGSTDGCPALCDRYAAQNDRVRVIHQPNKGLSGARNTGIRAAQGELLAFVDSDDTVSERMLETLWRLMQTCEADIASATYQDIKQTPPQIYTAEEGLLHLLKEDTGMTTSACFKLYRASVFDGILFPEGQIFEDYATIPLVYAQAKRIVHTEEKLYFYRRDNDNSIMHSQVKKQLAYYDVSDGIEQCMAARYPQLVKHVHIRRTRFSIAFYRQAAQSVPRDKETEKLLASYVRRGIFPYLFSSYKLTSKAYGLLIAVCPPLAVKLFRRN